MIGWSSVIFFISWRLGDEVAWPPTSYSVTRYISDIYLQIMMNGSQDPLRLIGIGLWQDAKDLWKGKLKTKILWVLGHIFGQTYQSWVVAIGVSGKTRGEYNYHILNLICTDTPLNQMNRNKSVWFIHQQGMAREDMWAEWCSLDNKKWWNMIWHLGFIKY